jgi:hypothetical protein
MARPCLVLVLGSNAVIRRRVAQQAAEKEAQMFEALAEFLRFPPIESNEACRKRQRRDDAPGSPFFWVLCFGEAKKRTSAAGPRPGKHPIKQCLSKSKT